jgi:thiamine pyrophosphokinase
VVADGPELQATSADVVVLTGGDPVDPARVPPLPDGARVVAADSGLAAAALLGLTADVVVGDMDSVAPTLLASAEADGARIDRHPAAKDATDLALAMDEAVRLGARRITVVGGAGGRLDHLLANALLLAADDYAAAHVVAHLGAATITVVRDEALLRGRRGELVSLLPVNGPAHGITTDGLLYPLHDETLAPGSSRGVSNELARRTAHVRLRSGVLLAVQPGALGTHLDDDTGGTRP